MLFVEQFETNIFFLLFLLETADQLINSVAEHFYFLDDLIVHATFDFLALLLFLGLDNILFSLLVDLCYQIGIIIIDLLDHDVMFLIVDFFILSHHYLDTMLVLFDLLIDVQYLLGLVDLFFLQLMLADHVVRVVATEQRTI